jgi:hypothetical protein
LRFSQGIFGESDLVQPGRQSVTTDENVVMLAISTRLSIEGLSASQEFHERI